MLEGVRIKIAAAIRRYVGEDPTGPAGSIVRKVQRGDYSLKEGDREVAMMENNYGLPKGSLRVKYDAALDKWAEANRPRTPRQDPLLY